MDKFQVYNRELKTWEDENIELVSGWKENFVLDKTTDTAQVKIKYKGSVVPDWGIGDWCRILHLNNDEVGATYNTSEILEDKLELKNFFTISKGSSNGVGFSIFFEMSNINVEQITATIRYSYSISSGDYITKTQEVVFSRKNKFFSFRLDNTETETYSNLYVTIDTVTPDVARRRSFVNIPKNHEQYIIKNIVSVADSLNNEIDIQIDLQEPIEITKGILCETMSFTNQIKKTVDGVEYTHEPLNHASVLSKILKVTPANNDTFTGLDYLDGHSSSFNKSWKYRIRIKDFELLENIPFNDETYSEPNLYEILLNKYDSSVGRTPVLYFDMSSDDRARGDKESYVLCFERQDGYDKEPITFDELKDGCKEIIVSKNNDNYTDGLVSNYDNLAPNFSNKHLAEKVWVVPQVNNNERDLTKYVSDSQVGIWILKLPHYIKKVNKLILIKVTGGIDNNLDITANRNIEEYQVLEEKQYIASSNYGTRNVVWFKEGENIIHLNPVYYKKSSFSGSTFYAENYAFFVEYEPLISGRFDLAQDHQTQINQIDSQIDNEKFGEYLKQYLASMNKADITITKTVESWKEIKDIGTRVIDNNKNYIITNVSVQNRQSEYDAVYQLNENHIRRSDAIQAPQEIRKNIEISVDATKERKSMLANIYKLSLSSISSRRYVFDRKVLFSSILNNYDNKNYPQFANIIFNSKYPFISNHGINYIELLCEISRFYMNNTICFNLKYVDNAEAGKSKDLPSSAYGVGMPTRQIPILYTDCFGEFDTFDLYINSFINYDISTEYIGNTFDSISKFWRKVRNNLLGTSKFPLPDILYDEAYDGNTLLSIKGINYYKDMLDTFNYTLGIRYESDNNIILCKNFFENNILMNNKDIRISKINCYNTNLKENDVVLSESIESANIDNVSLTNGHIEIALDKDLQKTKSIVIFDQNNKPVLIINDYDKSTGNTFNKIDLYC